MANLSILSLISTCVVEEFGLALGLILCQLVVNCICMFVSLNGP